MEEVLVVKAKDSLGCVAREDGSIRYQRGPIA